MDGSSDRELELARFLGEYQERLAEGASRNELSRLLDSRPDLAADLRLEIQAMAEFDALVDPVCSPQMFGEFKKLRFLGSGAWGIVFEAVQVSLDRRVALKILSPRALADPAAVKRFQREGRAAALVSHPHVVGVYAMGVEDGSPYIAMEYVEGETLDGIIDRLRRKAGATELLFDRAANGSKAEHGTPAAARTSELAGPQCLQAARVFAAVAEGLHAIHAEGIIHRDLKPSNMILDSEGRLRIFDFGLAFIEGQNQLTLPLELLGTPYYMSPEQARGERETLSLRTDIYSLGVSLYELITLRTPFNGRTAPVILERILHDDPIPPRRWNKHIPPDLEKIVLKCLRKDPSRRYATAEALAHDLKDFARGEPVHVDEEPFVERVIRRLRRHRKRILGGVAVFCAVAFLAGVLGQILAARNQAIQTAREEEYKRYESIVDDGVGLIEQGRFLLRSLGFTLLERERTSVPLGEKDARAVSQPQGSDSRLYELQPVLFEAVPALADLAANPVERGVARLDQAITTSSASYEAYYHRARGHHLLGKDQNALADVDRALKLRPGFPPAVALRAWILGQDVDGPAPTADLQGARDLEWALAWIRLERALRESDWPEILDAGQLLVARVEAGYYAGAALEHQPLMVVGRLKSADFLGALQDLAVFRERHPWRFEAALLEELVGMARDTIRKELEKSRPGRRAKAASDFFEQFYERQDEASRGEAAESIAVACREFGDFKRALHWTSRMPKGPAMLRLRSSLLSRSRGMEEAGIQAVGEALELDSADHLNWLAHGNALFALGMRKSAEGDSDASKGLLDQARASYLKAHGLDVRDSRPLLALGACLEQLGEGNEALSVLQKARALEPWSPSPHYSLAVFYSRRQMLPEARAEYEEVLRLDPRHAAAWNNLGSIFDRNGDLASAMKAYEKARLLSPELGIVHYNLGWVYQRRNMYSEAEAEYRQAIALGLHDEVYAHNNLGMCLQHQYKTSEALAAYERALKLDAENLVVRKAKGSLHLWLDQYHAAVGEYRHAVRLRPDVASFHDELGTALERSGRRADAVAEYLRAIELDSNHVWAHYHLASLLLRTGDAILGSREIEELLPALEDAVDLPNSNPAISQLIDRWRLALAPRLASFGSVDAKLPALETLVGEGALWSYFKGLAEPAEDLAWTHPDFDDSSWEKGHGAFGVHAPFRVGTQVEGMEDRCTTLYVRQEFEVADPSRLVNVILRVRCDGGFVAYLNGREAVRVRAGRPGVTLPSSTELDWSSDAEAEPWIRKELEVDRKLLVAGANVIAIQGLKPSWSVDFDFSLGAELVARPVFEAQAKEAALEALEAFRAGIQSLEPGDAARIAYFEARLEQLEGRPGAALLHLDRALALDGTRPEPYLRVMECLTALGDPAAADEVVQGALSMGLLETDSLWDAWFRLHAVDLGESVEEMLAAFPPVFPEHGAHPGELQWLLEEFSRSGAIRINSGGAAFTDPAGEAWSFDRFYRGGLDYYLYHLDSLDETAAERPLDKTERFFYEPRIPLRGYRFPLPNGPYRAHLHFIEGHFKNPGERLFDVILGGVAVREGFEPRFGIPEMLVIPRIEVTEGVLELDFVRQVENPNIAAIEILRL